jgi:hypothetical protein
MSMPALTPPIIEAAIIGFETQKQKIEAKIAELRAALPGAAPVSAEPPVPEVQPAKKKHTMSAKGRRNVRAALAKRWAAFHAAKAAKNKGKSRAATA